MNLKLLELEPKLNDKKKKKKVNLICISYNSVPVGWQNEQDFLDKIYE